MDNCKYIDELRQNFIAKFTTGNLNYLLEKDCSEEYELMRDYNGRQILELLQNVDDAYSAKKSKSGMNIYEEVEVKITYKNNILEVGNSGTTFTKETIERLCLGRASDKSEQNIGNKGTGFRSLLNDAEWIELYSGEYSIRFSDSYAKECFKKNLENKLIKNQVRKWKKDYPLCFPIMNCPEPIEQIDLKNVDTLIKVRLKENNNKKANGISNQLEQPFYKALLFLPNITKITIETEKEIQTVEKITDGNSVLIEKKVNTNSVFNEEYFVFAKNVVINKKNATLHIAVPKDEKYDFSKEKLYCYFPIRNFSTPINALINAPFVTNNSRDNVPNDAEEINTKIFDRLLFFIKEIAEKMANSRYGNSSIRMVLPTSYANSLWDKNGFNLYNKYLKLFVDAKILPTVNNDYISIKDNPKLLEKNFPKIFLGNPFKTLIKYFDIKKNYDFINELALLAKYDSLMLTEEELAKKINLISGKWDANEKVKVFLWWSCHFKSAKIVPNLLLDSQGKFIKKGDKVFLPTDKGVSELPDELSWVKLCVIKQDYVDELIRIIKTTQREKWENISSEFTAEYTSDKRILDSFSTKYLSVGFTEQSSSVLIISAINQQIDSSVKAKSFIKWFFANYKNKLKEKNDLSKIKFKFLDGKGNVKLSQSLFFGKDYGKPLGEKLFYNNNSYSSLMGPSYFVEDELIGDFIFFMEKCGVVEFPKIENKNFKINDKFSNFVKRKYSFNYNINYLTSKSIENFEELILKLETTEIMNLFALDRELHDLLISTKQESNAKQQSNRTGNFFDSNEYIKFILNNTPWITLGGIKYSPNQIVIYDKLGSNIPNLYGINKQEIIKIVGEDLFHYLDFKDSMGELKDIQIEILLKHLPNFDKGIISRKLYLDIIKLKKDLKPTFSISNILVLAKDNKFYNNNLVKYADKKISKTYKSKLKLISIQEKQSISTIENWFGVKRFETNLELINFDKFSSDIENAFEKEINNVKIAILSTIDSNIQNVNNIKALNIIPCMEVFVKETGQNEQKITLENFDFIDDRKKNYYLKLPKTKTEIEYLRLDEEFSIAIIGIFKQLLTIELDENLVELLVVRNIAKRKEKISEKFGIDKWDESSELILGENSTNKSVLEYFIANGSKKDNINKLKNINFSSLINNNDYETVILSLKEINKDINDLNEWININLKEYWIKKVSCYLSYRKKDYKQNLFYSLVGEKDLKERSLFLSKVDNFTDISYLSVPNSVNFDEKNFVLNLYPILNLNYTETNVETVYANNYEKLNPGKIFQDEIQNNGKVQIMIYFNDKNSFDNWIKDQKEMKKKEEATKEKDIYADYRDLVPEEEEFEFHEPKIKKTRKSKKRRGAHTKTAEANKQRILKEYGNKGELLIYNLLCEKYGDLNVFLKSEGFVDMGLLKPGQASSGEYDLSYKDENGNEIFVEVKTCDGKSFIITSGELEFAKKYSENFVIYIVMIADNKKPITRKLPCNFWVNENFRVEKIVEKFEVSF